MAICFLLFTKYYYASIYSEMNARVGLIFANLLFHKMYTNVLN